MSDVLLGVDVGGSSIKLASVDVVHGELAGALETLPLPQPSTPTTVIEAVLSSASARATRGPFGMGFPSVIKEGVALTAANVHPAWIGTDARSLLHSASGRSCEVLNDADAAGIAEMRFGAGRGLEGPVFVLTFGTGIGSALFMDGRLLPNTELGHLCVAGIDGMDAEQYASARTRTRLELGWAEWAARVNRYLAELQRLFWPEAFILGGAVSEHFECWGPHLSSQARILPAQLRGHAGVIGAALAAADRYNR